MGSAGLLRECVAFVRERRKYLLLPTIVLLVLMAVFILIAEIPVLTPFIYALF